jgi:cytochrome c biogenesis protein
LNMIVGSFKHVFPKLKLLRLPMPLLSSEAIKKLPIHLDMVVDRNTAHSRAIVADWLKRRGYHISGENNFLTAEYGKHGKLAPSVTHVGLLSLLFGITITSFTGFSGFAAVTPGQSFDFDEAHHSKLWCGKIPKWAVRVNSTERQDYDSGDVKQWYSNLSVLDANNKEIKNQTISVNNPLSHDGVDIYQSNWALKGIKLKFNNKSEILDVQPMGKLNAAFLPLPDQSVLIFSVRNQSSPVRIFAKRKDWDSPKLLAQLNRNENAKLGEVTVVYEGTVAQTGLQYKSDPGFFIVCIAFVFIITGVSLAAVPYRQVWVHFKVEDANNALDKDQTIVSIGASTKKAKQSLRKQIIALGNHLKKSGNNDMPGTITHALGIGAQSKEDHQLLKGSIS